MAIVCTGDDLRRAYHARVSCLGRKLRGLDLAPARKSPAASSAQRQTRVRASSSAACLPSSTRHDLEEAAAAAEIEALLRQVRSLCKERCALRRGREETECRFEEVLEGLRGKLSQEQEKQSRLESRAVELRRGELALDDEIQRVSLQTVAQTRKREDAEAQRLRDACRLLGKHLCALRSEACEYRQRIESIGQDDAAARGGAAETSTLQAAARGELEDVITRTRRSDLERDELEAKLSLVGKRFQHVVDATEKESREALRLLKEQRVNLRRKTDKQRSKIDELKVPICDIERVVSKQAAAIAEREADLVKVQEACKAQRDAAVEAQAEFFQIQRRELQAQASEFKRLGGMMSIAGHQQILKEQEEYYRECLRGLEASLQERARAQKEALKCRAEEMRERALAMQQYQNDMRRQHQLAQDRRQERLWEQWHMFQQGEVERGRLVEQLALEGCVADRCRELRSSIQEAELALSRLEATAAAAEDRRRSLATSLDSAGVEIGSLRTAFEVARRGWYAAQDAVVPARNGLELERRAVAVSVDAVAEAEAQERHQALATNRALTPLVAPVAYGVEGLRDALRRQQHQADSLALSSGQLREDFRSRSTECARLRSCIHAAEAKLLNLQDFAAKLEQELFVHENMVQRKEELLRRIVCLVRMHANLHGRAASELRVQMQENGFALDVEFKGCEQRWKYANSRASEQSLTQQHSENEKTARSAREVKELGTRLEGVRGRSAHTVRDADAAAEGASAAAIACKRLDATVNRVAVNTEQVVRSIRDGLPNLSEETVGALLSATGVAAGNVTSADMARVAERAAVVLRSISDGLPNLPDATVGTLLSATRLTAGNVTSADMASVAERAAVVDLEVDMRRAISVARTAAADEQRRCWVVVAERQKAQLEEGEALACALIKERRASVDAEIVSIEDELRTMDDNDAANHVWEADADLIQADAMKRQFAAAMAAENEAYLHAQELRLSLDAGNVEASMAMEEVERLAIAPFKAEVNKVTSQLKVLNSALNSEFINFEVDWRNYLDELKLAHQAREASVGAQLFEQAGANERELMQMVATRAEALQAQESQTDRIRTELAASLNSLNSCEDEHRHLRSLREATRRDTKHLQDALKRAERRIEDVSEIAAREQREIEEDEQQLEKLHAETIARLTRQKASEALRLEAFGAQSLSTLSAELSMDSDAALHAYGELKASAERLASRAWTNLNIGVSSTLGEVT